ncbi:amino acid ABC transporter permease [Paucidesulfovibrio longus]|uniref:amino acid ABC transporter permease n=1 Tax=Paucidesulfovibrio longus TaxID=889 RepID=UPI0003B758ED|nr:amino acid ABC transporter permease [Paucidesulfovibrio longus]
MIKYWLDKTWVQYLLLAGILGALILYWIYAFESPYKFQWNVLYEYNATYDKNFGVQLLRGLMMTVIISLISAVAALMLGVFFGLARLSHFKPLYGLATVYVEFFRNTPLLIQLFFWYYAFPQILPDAMRDWLYFDIDMTWFGMNVAFEFWCATVGLAVYTGSYMAEVIRAGLQSIPKGLLEAAYSSGLSYFQVLTKIILPIAFRNIIPPLGSEFLNNLKNSSLAMVVGVAELAWTSQDVEALTFKGFEAACAASGLYLLTCLFTSGVMNSINRKLQTSTGIARTSLADRCLDCCLAPLEMGYENVTRTFRRAERKRKLKRRAQAEVGLIPIWQVYVEKAWALIVLAFKIVFVLGLLYVGYKTVVAVAGYNWAGVAENLRVLVLYRFPAPASEAIYFGLGGLILTLIMAVIVLAVSFPIGLLVGLGRTSDNQLYRLPSLIYIELIRGNPLIMVIFWSYFFIGVVRGGNYLDAITSATIAMTIFNAAYIAEIVRSGIQNLPKGQFEAAFSTGLSYWQTMRKIVLPQSLKQMLPAIVGQSVAMIKDTSLAYIIGATELTLAAQIIINRRTDLIFEIYTVVAVLYFIMCYSLSLWARRLEQRLSPEKVRLEM